MIKPRTTSPGSTHTIRALSNEHMTEVAGGPPVAGDRERSRRLRDFIRRENLRTLREVNECLIDTMFD